MRRQPCVRCIAQGTDPAPPFVIPNEREGSRLSQPAAPIGNDCRPVAVRAQALFHFFADADRPAELMTRYLAALGPGSTSR